MKDFDRIIQILPCPFPVAAVFASNGILDGTEPVNLLALTESGNILGLFLSDGYFNICDKMSNFFGLCKSHKLEDFLSDSGIKN